MKSFLLILALTSAGLWAWEQGYRLNATASLPLGVYRVSPGPVARGDLVSVCLGGDFAELARQRGYLLPGICPVGLQPLLKHVAALPGDTVRLDEAGLCITPSGGELGCLWPAPRARDSKGRALPAELVAGVIPEGQALLLAPHPGSFDGRYFGFVSLNTLARVEQVITFNE